MERDQKTREEVLAIIENQLPDSEKINQSNFVIKNNIFSEIKSKSFLINNKILKNINNS